MNNTYIKNDKKKYACNIKFPKTCYYKIGKYFFDFTKLKGEECIKNKNTKKKLLEYSNHLYIDEKTKHIGFPLTNLNPNIPNNTYIEKFIKNHIIDLDNKKIFKKLYNNIQPEIMIDYSKHDYGDVIINLKFNDTLSKERKLKENNSFPYSNNIFIFYIDAVSRAYSMRKLKKTLKFIEYFMSYKGGYHYKYPNENYHSFQFFKYHSFSFYTYLNYPKIFYGKQTSENMIRITKYLKEIGYVTGFIYDMCLREPSNVKNVMSEEEITDHELIICDPNMKHPHSHVKRCYYNKISTEHVCEYGNQFWRNYSKNRKFLTITINDGHEGTLEVLKYTDEILYNFFKNLYNDNLLKETTLFLLSDHGTGSPSPYYLTEFYHLEKDLPMLYIICNDRKNISYYEQYQYIYKNQQIFITGYDIYNTIGHLVFGDKYKYIRNKTDKIDTPKSMFGQSLFNEINPKERHPKKYLEMSLKTCI